MAKSCRASTSRAFSIKGTTETNSNQLMGVSECCKCIILVHLAYFRGTQWLNHVEQALIGPFN